MRPIGSLRVGGGWLVLLVAWGLVGCASGERAMRGKADGLLQDEYCDGNPSVCESLRNFCELHPERCFGPMPVREEAVREEQQAGPPPTLNRCLDACAAGGEVLRKFCRSIRDPKLKAGCWGLEFVGETACRGWCFWHYGKQ